MNAGFTITGGKGFHVTFENGYAVSVQFGPGTYSEHYDDSFGPDHFPLYKYESYDAEVAVINKDGELIAMPEFGGDTVGSNYTPEMVLKLLNWAKDQK